jgi:hypothetical protein
METYFIILWDNQPIQIDQSSGGYPYKVTKLREAKGFNTQSEAENYMKKFQYQTTFEDMKVMLMSLRIIG